MKVEIEMYDGEIVASYEDTPELKQAVFSKLMNWFQKNSFLSGEAMQNDTFNIEAPEILADILDDIIKFEYKIKN